MFVLSRTLIIGFTILLTNYEFAHAAEPPKPNVLFIAVDDLNHWVGHLGRNPQTKTPNIDRLAKMGVTFTNAHCAAPVCNPSRAALLSGMRPGTTGIYDNGQPFGLTLNAEQSLVTQFRRSGYETLGMGKLWHGGLGFPEQWTNTGGPEHAANHRANQLEDHSIGGIKFGVLSAGDEAVPDTLISDYVISELGKPHDMPFFLTAGFHKPHMPWNVPKKYFDMHPLDQIQLPPVKDGDLNDVPASGIRMAKPEGDHRNVLESGRWKEAVQAYLATISYLDGQLGRLLDALEKSPHRDNTIICLWGDHGWHLGEKEHWRKFALWEEATRAPFIWVVHGVTTAGSVCIRPVDFMTIYPTLCDLAGVALPPHVEGTSIRSLLANPASTESRVAVTTFGRNNHAVRDDRWRYIRYADGSEELYDHSTDPYEWTNLAAEPAHVELKEQLATHFPKVNVPTATTARAQKSDGENGKPQKQKRRLQKNAKVNPVSIRKRDQRTTNIVFFVVDDLGQRDLGCYGSSFYETPHLDRLASEGALFPNAYATCPVCSPTRASIMTGQYPQRTGITDYIGAAQPAKWKRNTPHLPAPYTEQLSLEYVTLAESLKSHGYTTFFAGKWHLGGEGFSPEDQGFDINMGGLERGGPYGGKKYFSPYGNPKLPDGPDGEHLPDRLASEAAKFIEQNHDKPFFVYLPFYSVHTPLIARPDLVEKYEKKRSYLGQHDVFGDEPPRKVRLTQDHAVYAGMVEAMDQAVGKVVAKLDDLGLANDTLVIMTSDNGGLSTSEGSPTSNLPLRAGKGWLYEGGTRTSLIMRWPGVIAPGMVNESRVISADYFPTILDAADLPLEPEHHKDGVSHLTSLKSGEPTANRPLFWHYPHYGNQGGAPGASVLDGNWKLIEWFDSDTVELFNLAADPGETRNLATEEHSQVERLQEALHSWQADVGAVRSEVNPKFDSLKPNGRG
jgi:arylsulfatase A-like enzyme